MPDLSPSPVPDLSPSEEMLIQYIRAGRLDAEIAVRLGISVGDVKARTERLLRKLNLPDRAALATFDPQTRSSPSGSVHQLPPDLPPDTRFTFMRWSIAAGLALVAAAIAIAIAFTSSNPPDPLAGLAPTPTARPAQTNPPPVTPTPLFAQHELELSDFTALALTGCFVPAANECPPLELVRISRTDHEEQLTPLFSVEPPACLSGAAASPDGTHILVAVRDQDGCVLFGTARWPELALGRTLLFHSPDGGTSWDEFADLPGAHRLIALAQPSGEVTAVLESGPHFFDARASPQHILVTAGGHVQAGDPTATAAFIDFDGAIVWGDGRSLWREQPVRSPSLGRASRLFGFVPFPGPGHYLLSWVETDPSTGDIVAGLTGVVDRDTGTLLESWAGLPGAHWWFQGVMPDSTAYFALGLRPRPGPFLPLLFDSESREVHWVAGDHWHLLSPCFGPRSILSFITPPE